MGARRTRDDSRAASSARNGQRRSSSSSNGSKVRASSGAARSSSAKRKTNRDWWLLVLFCIFAVFVIGKLYYTQVIEGNDYALEAKEQRTSDITLPARRGTIYDRNGNVLATSIEATTVYADPRDITNPVDTAKQLAGILGGDVNTYTEKLSRDDTSFVYIERQVDVSVADEVKELGLPGIAFIDDSKRVYPYNEIAGQVVGFVGTEGNGLYGLELYYDDVLSGTDGELVTERGLGNIPISGGTISETPARDGQDIVVSIDIDLQQYVEQQLSQTVVDTTAEGGTIMVMDGATGEIYASASYPLLDPNDWKNSPSDAFVLKGISNAYEPGSTFKAITATAAVDQGVVKPEEVIDVPSHLYIDGYTISDSHAHGDEQLTFAEVIAQSSNIGTATVESRLESKVFYDYITKFGFGSDPGVDFPGSADGILADYENWSDVQEANISFGQGISISALQLTRAYGAFANEGILSTPHFLVSMPGSDSTPEWEQTHILPITTVDTVTGLLEGVITSGTAPGAAMEGYTVAGKTGTGQRADGSGGYQADAYTISFVGWLPNTDSDLVCATVLDNPNIGNSTVLWKDVMTFATDRYKIKPDVSNTADGTGAQQ